MNADKTKVMFCGSTQRLNNVNINSIDVDDDLIDFSNSVRNHAFFLTKTSK